MIRFGEQLRYLGQQTLAEGGREARRPSRSFAGAQCFYSDCQGLNVTAAQDSRLVPADEAIWAARCDDRSGLAPDTTLEGATAKAYCRCC